MCERPPFDHTLFVDTKPRLGWAGRAPPGKKVLARFVSSFVTPALLASLHGHGFEIPRCWHRVNATLAVAYFAIDPLRYSLGSTPEEHRSFESLQCLGR